MDQINPFTNAPTNASGQPTPPVQPGKPATPKQKKEFDFKPIIKSIVMLIIGVVIAKLAFDSVMPMFKPAPKPASKITKKQTKTSTKAGTPGAKTSGSAKNRKGAAEPPPSLSEQFAAAKQAAKPVPAQTEPFVINGIFLSEADGKSSAIINNKIVQVGDTVDDAVVKSITLEGVELLKVDETIKLYNR